MQKIVCNGERAGLYNPFDFKLITYSVQLSFLTVTY